MPQLAKMAGNRLIVQQSVDVRHGLPKDTASQRIGKLFK
jgi:hypothetical protein